MNGTNPTLIEVGPVKGDRAPLVLLHDSGGTIFQYFSFGPLKRAVYGIDNSHILTREPWESLPAMAKEYAALIKTVIPNGKLLLGGWSLGGLVSLEVARILEEDPDITVIGMVFIDSANPHPPKDPSLTVVPHVPKFEGHTKPQIRDMVLWSMQDSMRIVDEWTVPTDYQPPRTILLRCREYVEATKASEKSVCRIDRSRHQRLLGWQNHDKDFIKTVLDIDGDHYSLFAGKNADVVYTKLNQACDLLERAF